MGQREHQIKYISLAEASKLCQYSQEYLSLRARQKKLKAVKSRRNWVTTEEWLDEYLEKVSLKERKKKKFIRADFAIAPEVSPKLTLDKVMQFRGVATGLPRVKRRGRHATFRRHAVAAFAKTAAALLAMTRAVKSPLMSLQNTKKKFHLVLENLKFFQREFADVARLVVIFILIGSAIFFAAKPGVEVAKLQAPRILHNGEQKLNSIAKNFLHGARVIRQYSWQESARNIKQDVQQSVFRLKVEFQSSSFSLKEGIHKTAEHFLATYKTGLETIASAYGKAPENIAIKWAEVEQGNENVKSALRSNVKNSAVAAGRVWQSAQHLTFNDIAYGAENLMVRSGKKTFAALLKVDAEYQSLKSKYNGEKGQIKESIASTRLAYGNKKIQVKNGLNFIKLHPEAAFKKAFSPIARMNNNLLANFEYVKAQTFKGVSHFAAHYKIGLRVVDDSYNNGPRNIAMGWRKLEERNEEAKIGLRSGVARGGLALANIWNNTRKGVAGELGLGSEKIITSSQLLFQRISLHRVPVQRPLNIWSDSREAVIGQWRVGSEEIVTSLRISVRNSAFAFARFADAFGRGAEEIYSGIRSACQIIASKLVGTYEFAVEILRSAQRPEEIAVKKPQQQIKETASEQKQGMIVVPSTDKDEETKKKIRDSFSDEVKVEIQDDSSGIITPVFRDKEGDRYLYMMVPLKENN